MTLSAEEAAGLVTLVDALDEKTMRGVHHDRLRGRKWHDIQDKVRTGGYGGQKLPLTVADLRALYKEYLKEYQGVEGDLSGHQRRMLAEEAFDMQINDLYNTLDQMLPHDPQRARIHGELTRIQAAKAKILGYEAALDPTDKVVQQAVLVIGNDQRTWMEALAAGQEQRPMREIEA